MALRDAHPLQGETGFVWRGRSASRLEALSDMVFAFALTLLVVSAAPPESFADVAALLWGFPGFAAAFAILLVIWHSHYLFFRRYGLEDGRTLLLNAALLFIVLFFVYPLKLIAGFLSLFLEALITAGPAPGIGLADAATALAVYSAGYAGVFLVFAALYAHALSHADRLELSAEERRLTRASVLGAALHAGVGAGVVAGALLLPPLAAPFSGFLYFLIWPGHLAIDRLAQRAPAQS